MKAASRKIPNLVRGVIGAAVILILLWIFHDLLRGDSKVMLELFAAIYLFLQMDKLVGHVGELRKNSARLVALSERMEQSILAIERSTRASRGLPSELLFRNRD